MADVRKKHLERLQALEDVFEKQSAEAIRRSKVNKIVSLNVICELAGVPRNHVYGKTSPLEDIKEKYADFRRRVQGFIDAFNDGRKSAKSDTESEEAMLQQALEDNQLLKKELTDERAQNRLLRDRHNNLLAKNTHMEQMLVNPTKLNNQKVETLAGATKNIICPDDHLERNGRYEFNNPQQRNLAWEKAITEFITLMKRNVPQRIYLLCGPPCAGKSTWAKGDNVAFDRHAVIVDATNLTAGDRAKWLAQIPHNKGVKVCVVRFLVDDMTLKSRNVQRHHKQIDVDILERKIKSLEEVNPHFEAVDEMLFVRSDDD